MTRYLLIVFCILSVVVGYHFYPVVAQAVHSRMEASSAQQERNDAQAQADEFVESMSFHMLPPHTPSQTPTPDPIDHTTESRSDEWLDRIHMARRYTFNQLNSFYEDNVISTENMIGGREVFLVGQVDSIDSDMFTGKPVLRIVNGDDSFNRHSIYLGESARVQASLLKRGQTVYVICPKTDFSMRHITGSDCEIVPAKYVPSDVLGSS